MEWNRQNIKGLLLVVCGGVAFYCALQNLDVVWGAVRALLGILAPFLLGGALAFILNVPMRAIERHLFPSSRKGAKLRRPPRAGGRDPRPARPFAPPGPRRPPNLREGKLSA